MVEQSCFASRGYKCPFGSSPDRPSLQPEVGCGSLTLGRPRRPVGAEALVHVDSLKLGRADSEADLNSKLPFGLKV